MSKTTAKRKDAARSWTYGIAAGLLGPRSLSPGFGLILAGPVPGENALAFREYFPGLVLTAADYSEDYASRAGADRVYVGDAGKIPLLPDHEGHRFVDLDFCGFAPSLEESVRTWAERGMAKAAVLQVTFLRAREACSKELREEGREAEVLAELFPNSPDPDLDAGRLSRIWPPGWELSALVTYAGEGKVPMAIAQFSRGLKVKALRRANVKLVRRKIWTCLDSQASVTGSDGEEPAPSKGEAP